MQNLLFRRLGWDVRRVVGYPSSEEVLLKPIFDRGRSECGASTWACQRRPVRAMSLRKCGFEGRIVSFEEPSRRRTCSPLGRRGPDHDWLVAPCCALGQYDGRIQYQRGSKLRQQQPASDARRAPASLSRLRLRRA